MSGINGQNVKNLLGIIKKSGKLEAGMDKTRESVLKGECKLLIYAEDAGLNTFKKIEGLSRENEIDLFKWGLKETLGEELGMKPVAVISINDKKFADKLRELF